MKTRCFGKVFHFKKKRKKNSVTDEKSSVTKIYYNYVYNGRFPDDVNDRIWEPYKWSSTMNTISTNLTFDVDVDDPYREPQAVISTAVTPKNASAPILFSWKPNSPTDKYFIVLYFGEVQILLQNQTREFVTKLNEINQSNYNS